MRSLQTLHPRPVPWCPKAYRLAAEKAVDNQGHYKPELAKAGVSERICKGKMLKGDCRTFPPYFFRYFLHF